VITPILSNIYLDRLDKFVEKTLLPDHNRGKTRKVNPEYQRLRSRRQWLRTKGKDGEALELLKQMRGIPSKAPDDPAYRRLRYVRYADDFLLGFAGPREEAEAVKRRLKEFMRDELKLELSEEKTHITHARTEAARFLGYDIVVLGNDRKVDRRGHRSINGQIGFKVPAEVVRAKCAPYLKGGKPIHRPERINDSVFSIVAHYQQEFRGIVGYYRLAYDLSTKLKRLKWVMETSLTKTLASKLRISVRKVYRRYGATVRTERGSYKVLTVEVERGGSKEPLVAQWGGISLARDRNAFIDDHPRCVWNNERTELLQRLLADTCELCGSKEGVLVHHVRNLKDLQRKGRTAKPEWVKQMAARRRKTLVVCRKCHKRIHDGKHFGKSVKRNVGHRRAG
jgi:hypothetical protein